MQNYCSGSYDGKCIALIMHGRSTVQVKAGVSNEGTLPARFSNTGVRVCTSDARIFDNFSMDGRNSCEFYE